MGRNERFSKIERNPLRTMPPAKTPVVLVHVLDERNFSETITSIKLVGNFSALGREVQKIRRMKEGHALVEFAKNPEAYAAASRLDEVIRSKPEFEVGRVACLRLLTEARLRILTLPRPSGMS